MKKRIALILSFATVFALCACGNSTKPVEETSAPIDRAQIEQLKDVTDIYDLAQNIHSIREFFLYTNTAGLREGPSNEINVLLETKYGQPKAFSTLMAEVLADDYEETGIVYLKCDRETYPMCYVKNGEYFEIYDPAHGSSQYVPHEKELDALIEKACTRDSNWSFDSAMSYSQIIPELARVDKAQIEQLKDETDIITLSQNIHSVDEFFLYTNTAGLKEGPEDKINVLLETKYGQPSAFSELMATLLADDYEEAGIVYLQCDRETYPMCYVKNGEYYEIYDPAHSSSQFVPHETNLDALIEKACTKDPYWSFDSSMSYATKTSALYHGTVVAPNGETIYLTEDYGIETFYYAGTTFPLALGLPELTDEQIDELINSDDYRYIRDSINTCADFANYIRRAGYTHKRSDVRIREGAGYVEYTMSGAQQLLVHDGCYAISNSATYCLKDCYDEIGYISISCHTHGHYLNYIKQDGIYYAFNAETYLPEFTPDRWMSDYAGDIWASENFQDIADSFASAGFGQETDNIYLVYSCVANGDIVVFMPDYPDEEHWHEEVRRYYPEDVDAVCWYGPSIKYFKPVQDWQSQEFFRELEVYRASDGDAWK